MAVAQTDLTNDAYERTGIFENEKQHGGYSAVAALYTEACQIVVKADSSINTVEDHQDKRVSVGEEGVWYRAECRKRFLQSWS